MNKKKSRDEVINVKALEALIAEHGHSPEAILGKEGHRIFSAGNSPSATAIETVPRA